MTRQPTSLAALSASLAAALAAAYASAASAGPPGGQEACYGIALKGQNDCAAGNHSCAGKATANFGRTEFAYVPAGSCTKMNVQGHKGSLTERAAINLNRRDSRIGEILIQPAGWRTEASRDGWSLFAGFAGSCD